MKRILICTGVLGGGTALVFAAAALAATIAPGGTVVPGNIQQPGLMLRNMGGPIDVTSGGFSKTIGPDGSVIFQGGLGNNFGVVNVTTGTAVSVAPAPAPAVDLPLTVTPTGTEAP